MELHTTLDLILSYIYIYITLYLKYKSNASQQTCGLTVAHNNNIHLMCAPEGNSEFCFPESLNVSRDEVEGNIETRGKTKLTISRGSAH